MWVKNLTTVAWVTAEVPVWSPVWNSGLKDTALLPKGLGHSCGSDSIPGLGTSICHGAVIKKKKKPPSNSGFKLPLRTIFPSFYNLSFLPFPPFSQYWLSMHPLLGRAGLSGLSAFLTLNLYSASVSVDWLLDILYSVCQFWWFRISCRPLLLNLLNKGQKHSKNMSSHCGSAVTNPTGIHEDSGLIPGLDQWVKDPALPWATV